MFHKKALLGIFTRSQRSLTTIYFFMLVLLLTLVNPTAVIAQGEDAEPPWYQNLTCSDAQQQYQGLEYCTGLNDRAHVLVIDLEDRSGIRFEYIIASGIDRDGNTGPCGDVNIPQWSSGPGCADPANASYYPIMSLTQAVARFPNPAAVMNTDYGAGSQNQPTSRGHGPEGLTVIAGARLDGPLPNGPNDTDNNAVKRPWIAISETAPFQVLFDQLDSDDGSKPEGWMYTAVGGAPWLIRNGQKQDDQIDNCSNAESWSCESTTSQTAVAISQDRRWLYLVVAVGVEPPPNSNDNGADVITDFMLETLEPWEAIKFDGGGSSQLWYGGLSENQREVTPHDRQLSQYLAIIAPPGDGIDLEPTSPIPPLPEPDFEGWWERISSGIQTWWDETWPPLQDQITDWWDRTWDDLEQRVADWWDEQMDALARWIETELSNALNQLCGAAAILPVGLAFVAWRQNRYSQQSKAKRIHEEKINE